MMRKILLPSAALMVLLALTWPSSDQSASRALTVPRPTASRVHGEVLPRALPERALDQAKPRPIRPQAGWIRRSQASARRLRTAAAAKAPRGVSVMILAGARKQREAVWTSKDPRELQAAVWAIGNRLRLTDEDAEAIRDVLFRPAIGQQPDLLRTALWAISLRPDQIPVELVARVAGSHRSASVRRMALRALVLQRGGRALAALEAATTDDADEINRNEARLFTTMLRRLRKGGVR